MSQFSPNKTNQGTFSWVPLNHLSTGRFSQSRSRHPEGKTILDTWEPERKKQNGSRERDGGERTAEDNILPASKLVRKTSVVVLKPKEKLTSADNP